MDRLKEKKGIVTGAFYYAPFLLAALVGLSYHLKIGPIAGDDLFFAAATDDKTIWEFLRLRYETWTSRIVIDFLVVSLLPHLWLWKLLDLLVFASLPVLFTRIVGDSRLVRWCSAAAVLLYPFQDVGSAGWVTTTVNYLWPVWGILVVGVLLRKMILSERIRWYEGVFGGLACILASSHEQAAAVLFLILVLAGIFLIRKKCLKAPVFYILALLNIASLAFILLCPGNGNRNVVGTADMPEFGQFSVLDKAYLGALGIERVFIAKVDIVFFVAAALLAVLVYIRTDSYRKTVLSAIPLLILLGHSVILTAYPELSGIFVVPEKVTSWEWSSLSVWMPMFYLAAVMLSVLYALYCLLKDDLFVWLCALLLLGCGFAAGLVIGFTATIYVSGDRVYITLYFILLYLLLYVIRKLEAEVSRRIAGTAGRLCVTAVALVLLVNVGYIWLSVS